MSNYKYPTPQLLFKGICDAIREKTGSNNKIAHQDIPDELDNIMTEEEYEIAAQELSNVIYGSEMKILDSKYISSIPDKGFYNNSRITTVNLPNCTSIGECAFHVCKNLTTVNLPKCTSIIINAFYVCNNLTIVNLPKCTYIGDAAFGFCDNLTTLILANNRVVSLANNSGYDIFCGVIPTNISIYVPDNLVSSYKTAYNSWRDYITPLSELPSNLKEEYGYD